MQFSLSISMLRMNHTNDDLEYFFGEMDEEFQTLESIIKDGGCRCSKGRREDL